MVDAPHVQLFQPTASPGLAAEWDAFVASAHADLVQTTRWGAVKAERGARVHVLVVRAGASVLGGAAIHVRTVGRLLRIATVTKGPVLASDDPTSARIVGEALDRAFADLGVRVAVVQCPGDGRSMDAYLRRAGLVAGAPPIAPVASTWLDLERTDDELQAAMSSMRKRNVRSSVKLVASGALQVEFDESPEAFHRVHTASAARQGFEPLERATLEAQWRHLAPAGAVHSLVARHEGVVVAGIWLTSFAGTVTYKLPGWDPSLPQPKHVNEALHWHAVRWARSIGATRYDFGGFDRAAAELVVSGSELPEGFDRTPSNFKLGFGGAVELQPLARLQVRVPLVGRVVALTATKAMASPRARRWIGRFRNR